MIHKSTPAFPYHSTGQNKSKGQTQISRVREAYPVFSGKVLKIYIVDICEAVLHVIFHLSTHYDTFLFLISIEILFD